MILLNNMGTFNRDLNPHLAPIIQIMQSNSKLPTTERMYPEDEAEVEEGGKETEG